MSNPQIYKVIRFETDALGRFNYSIGSANYITDKLAVAQALKVPGTRVFTFPEFIEITEVNVELVCQKQS